MTPALRFLSTRSSISRLGVPMSVNATSNLAPGPYAGWTRERLIERLMQLECPPQERDVTTGPLTSTMALPTKPEGSFDFSKHPRRKIALKFCYSGWEYSGLAHQMGPSPLPTVENVLFDSMAKAHLVDPTAGLDGCGWEKCGRTDRGVSAAGQVISLWIRSQICPSIEGQAEEDTAVEELDKGVSEVLTDDAFGALSLDTDPTSTFTSQTKVLKPNQEIDYLNVLNRLLPDTIRIIAWSPVSDTFSARFSCKYRHYKYFFSSLNLDIPRMQAAVTRLLGEHDFRNLSKLDAQKQLTSFKRKIVRASITPLCETDNDGQDKMYVFDLVGTAFLYHQVRHIMAALFLVGSGLEPPEIITELMNVEAGAEPMRAEDVARGAPYAVVDSKPDYQMADALPLMLWECGYDESELDWRTCGRTTSKGDLYQQLGGIYTRSRVYSVLDQHFMTAVAAHHSPPSKNRAEQLDDKSARERVINVPLGGGTFKRLQKYKPLLERPRLDTVEVMNERWRLGKGSRRDARKVAAMADNDE